MPAPAGVSVRGLVLSSCAAALPAGIARGGLHGFGCAQAAGHAGAFDMQHESAYTGAYPLAPGAGKPAKMCCQNKLRLQLHLLPPSS